MKDTRREEGKNKICTKKKIKRENATSLIQIIEMHNLRPSREPCMCVCVCNAGHTLDNFKPGSKPDLPPSTIRGVWPDPWLGYNVAYLSIVLFGVNTIILVLLIELEPFQLADIQLFLIFFNQATSDGCPETANKSEQSRRIRNWMYWCILTVPPFSSAYTPSDLLLKSRLIRRASVRSFLSNHSCGLQTANVWPCLLCAFEWLCCFWSPTFSKLVNCRASDLLQGRHPQHVWLDGWDLKSEKVYKS